MDSKGDSMAPEEALKPRRRRRRRLLVGAVLALLALSPVLFDEISTAIVRCRIEGILAPYRTDDPPAKEAAVRRLAFFSSDAAVTHLVRYVGDANPDIDEIARGALREIGTKAAAAIGGELRRRVRQWRTRQRAQSVLPSVLHRLVERTRLLGDVSGVGEYEWKCLIEAIIWLGPDAVAELSRMCRDKDPRVRQVGMQCLAEVADPLGFDTLVAGLSDTAAGWDIDELAASAIAKTYDHYAYESMVPAPGRKRRYEHDWTAYEGIRDRAVEPLLAFYRRFPYGSALAALGGYWHDERVPDVIFGAATVTDRVGNDADLAKTARRVITGGHATYEKSVAVARYLGHDNPDARKLAVEYFVDAYDRRKVEVLICSHAAGDANGRASVVEAMRLISTSRRQLPYMSPQEWRILQDDASRALEQIESRESREE